jgi:hypothetical protein
MEDMKIMKAFSMTPVMMLAALLLSAFAARAEVSTSRNYTDVKNYLENLAKQYPKTVSTFILGDSDSGDKIEGVKIGDGPVHNLLVATHHGNEYGSEELALAFADAVAKNPIQGQTMYVIPVLNIDGFNNRDRYEHDSQGRSDDPNRDYPGPCGTEGPFHLKSTEALANFIDRENIVVSSTLHTYWPAVVYPWGISTQDLATPYDPQYIQLVQTATAQSHYQYGNNTQLIYPADGAFEDYAYWKHGIWSLLFEVGDSHTPDEGDLTAINQGNVPGLIAMYKSAPTERAPKHDFTGKCDISLRILDLHIE